MVPCVAVCIVLSGAVKNSEVRVVRVCGGRIQNARRGWD